MAYFMIDGVDISKYVSALRVNKSNIYNAQTNAAGNTVVDVINAKREIEITIIPINDVIMSELQNAIDAFNVSISFRNPKTNELETINSIIADNNTEYYTIQNNKVLYKPFNLKFTEL